MAQPIISVEHLSRKYSISHQGRGRSQYSTLREALSSKSRDLVSRLTPGRRNGHDLDTAPTQEDFWALKDVSFEVQQGEVLGIIGRNGAGKSTLLKILSRITEPTEGRVTLRGRVASLLEVGTGFHPELTGRENVYLNGAILGMSRAEIKRKFDEIVDFAGVEKFLDTPVKRYSSGMYVRLAFAVAAHLEPEILIVDEVLAVGDAEFQKKCMGKMQDVATKDGRTVLFVSHNTAAIRQLTNRSLLLRSGRLLISGATQTILEQYLKIGDDDLQTIFEVEHTPRIYGDKRLTILKAWFDRDLPQFGYHEPFTFTVRVRANDQIIACRPNLVVVSTDGTPVGMAFSKEAQSLDKGAVLEFLVSLPQHNLAPGYYQCHLGFGWGDPRAGHVDYDVVTDTLQFEMLSAILSPGIVGRWSTTWGRTIYPELSCNPVQVIHDSACI